MPRCLMAKKWKAYPWQDRAENTVTEIQPKIIETTATSIDVASVTSIIIEEEEEIDVVGDSSSMHLLLLLFFLFNVSMHFHHRILAAHLIHSQLALNRWPRSMTECIQFNWLLIQRFSITITFPPSNYKQPRQQE